MRIKTEVINNKRGVFRALRFLVCITLLLVATPKAGAQTVWNGWIDESWYNSDESEFTLTTAAELAGLAKLVNNGTDNFSGKTVKLGKDIVLNGTRYWESWGESSIPVNTWTAIGNWGKPFSGTFDGQGHVVRGIYISKMQEYQGLFGYIEGGTVMNVGVEESFIRGNMCVGGIVGYVVDGSEVSNCYNTGTVSGLEWVGGIVGEVNGSEVSNCYNAGDVSSSRGYIGGIAGQIAPKSSVSSCYNTGFVKAINSYSSVGGIAGYCSSEDPVSNCYYLKGSADKGIGYKDDENTVTESKDKSAFENGEVAHLLQGDQDTPVWGQYLGTGTAGLPVLGGPKVVADGSGYKNALWPGENENEYLISTADELRVFAELVNAGDNFRDKTVKLANDIELNDTDGWDKWGTVPPENTWTAIGNWGKPFSGTFDGQGHVVRGIYISNDRPLYQGLFGYIEGGTVINVGVVESFIGGHMAVGGIAGFILSSSVSNCYNTGTVSGLERVGGIAGSVYNSEVSNCYNTGAVSGSSSVGGVAGYVSVSVSSVSNCYYLEGSANAGIGAMNDGDDVTKKTKTEFASGEVANLLGEEWAQAIDGDDFPVLMSHLSEEEKAKKKVYTVTFTYPEDPEQPDGDKENIYKYRNVGKYGIEDLLTPEETPTAFGYTIEWKSQSVTIADNDVEIEGTWILSEIVINEEIPYELKHKDKLLRIVSDGMLTINVPDASVKRLTIEEGGMLSLQQPLTVTNGLMIERTLQNQWETFCPPTGLTAEEIAINAGGGLWLSTGFRNANNQTWTEVDALTSGTPYIIAGDDVNGTKVSFSHTDEIMLPAATATQLETPEADGILLFQGNPSFAEKEVHDVYVLNDKGTAFELRENYTMQPFECVLTANAATRNVLKSFRLADGNPTGVIELLRGDFRAWGADGLLHLRSAAPADVHIYNVGGSPVTHLPALAGDRTLRLPAGIYLVKYKQTTIKIKL